MRRFFHRVLLFQFLQILTQGLMDLGRFHQLLARDAALFRGIGFHKTAIYRQLLAPYQPHLHTLAHDLFKQLLEQLRFLKPSVPVLGKGGVVGNLLIQAQPGEPAPCQMHAQLFHQLALAGDAVQIANQQDAQ